MIHAREDYNRIQDPEGIIPDDEPVFLLRGKDIAAPEAIDAWINAARRYGADERILEAAAGQADKMRDWQHMMECKVPDMP